VPPRRECFPALAIVERSHRHLPTTSDSPGQYFDAETGKHYNYFRDYDANLGRYLASDPLGIDAGLGTYTYAWNRPAVLLDPLGLDAVFPSGTGAGFGGALGDALAGIGRVCARAPLLFILLASSNGDACSDDPGRTRTECKAKACDEEWRGARQRCRELIYEQMQQQAGRRKKRSVTGVTGGYTDIEECARGLVSQECGGNKVDHGGKGRR
jgi:RHS repeat-associated protein